MYTSSCLYDYFLDCKVQLLRACLYQKYLDTNKNKRLNGRKINQEHERQKFVDSNWIKLLKSGSLPRLRVWQFDKYLQYFMLSDAKNFKKQQKLWFIQKHIVSNKNIEQKEMAASQNHVCKKLSPFTSPPSPSPPKTVYSNVSRSQYSLIKVTFWCILEVMLN